MTIETMDREFRYDNLRVPDPNKRLTASMKSGRPSRRRIRKSRPRVLQGRRPSATSSSTTLRKRSAPKDEQEARPGRIAARDRRTHRQD